MLLFVILVWLYEMASIVPSNDAPIILNVDVPYNKKLQNRRIRHTILKEDYSVTHARDKKNVALYFAMCEDFRNFARDLM